MPDLSKDDVARLLGAPEKLATELSEFAQAAKVLSSDHPRLIDEHPNQWVGVFDEHVAVTADSLTALMTKLAAEGIPADRTIVRFIDREEKTLLL